MKIKHDGKAVIDQNEQDKKLIIDTLLKSYKEAAEEVSECPCCKSTCIFTKNQDEKDFDTSIRRYFIAGSCEDCNSEFESKSVFEVSELDEYITYDDETKEFVITNNLGDEKVASNIKIVCGILVTLFALAWIGFFHWLGGAGVRSEGVTTATAATCWFTFCISLVGALPIWGGVSFFISAYRHRYIWNAYCETTDRLNEYKPQCPFFIDDSDKDEKFFDALSRLGDNNVLDILESAALKEKDRENT